MEPWFFFSYARNDSATVLTDFFEELARRVRSKGALPADSAPDEIGFMDRTGVELGQEWPPALLEALLSSRVMVVLLSRGYLSSLACGRELEVFRRRRDEYAKTLAAGAKALPIVLPVLWDFPPKLPDPLPGALSKLQYDHAAFGDVYSSSGLRTVASQSRHADDYDQFLDEFAERLVAAATPNAFPRVEVPEFAALPSALHAGVAPAVQAAQPQQGAGATASFVFFVGTAAELGAIRQDVTMYGAENWGWRPFAPDVDKRADVLAQNAASKEELYGERTLVDDTLLERLDAAEKQQTMVLFVVDPWSARLDPYKECLRKIDKLRLINAEVLVLWNSRDEETAAEHDSLLEDLQATAYRMYVLNTASVRDSITSVDMFEEQVIAAINEIRRRLMQFGTPRKVRRNGTSGSIPFLSGPGST